MNVDRSVLHRALWLAVLDRYRGLGPVLLRFFIAFVLIYGTQDNIFERARMLEFRDFLAHHGFPQPLASAYLSAYAQFIAGSLIAVGLLTRWAAAVMVVNFVVAMAMVHVGLPFSANIAPMAMLVGAVFLVLYGPGRFSLDGRLRGRTQREDVGPSGGVRLLLD